MSVRVSKVIGVYCKDPLLPSHLFLTEEGDLTPSIKKAKMLSGTEDIDLPLKEAKKIYKNAFSIDVIQDRDL